MNRPVSALASLALGACLSSGAHAQSTAFRGAVELGSQLVDRGQAITANTPILQGAVSWTSPAGWSLGLLAGTELHTPGHLAEASVQLSRYWPLSGGGWQMQTDLLYYRYSGTTHTRSFDRTEAGVHWLYRDVLTVGLSAVRVLGVGDHRLRGAADLDFQWPLPGHFYFSAGAGIAQGAAVSYRAYEHAGPYREHGSPDFYRYGQAGLTWAMGDWRAELQRIVTAPRVRRRHGAPGAAPWVATISWSF